MIGSLHVVDVIEFVGCFALGLILFVGDLPDLEDVVLGAGGHHEALVEVPRDVLDLRCVAAVKEHQLRGSISLLFFCLLGTASSQVPDHDATIRGGGGQQVALMPAEFHLIDLISMLSKAEKFGSHVTSVPDSHTLISTARNHQILIEW